MTSTEKELVKEEDESQKVANRSENGEVNEEDNVTFESMGKEQEEMKNEIINEKNDKVCDVEEKVSPVEEITIDSKEEKTEENLEPAVIEKYDDDNENVTASNCVLENSEKLDRNDVEPLDSNRDETETARRTNAGPSRTSIPRSSEAKKVVRKRRNLHRDSTGSRERPRVGSRRSKIPTPEVGSRRRRVI